MISQGSIPTYHKGPASQHTALVKFVAGYITVGCPACCALSGRDCRNARLEKVSGRVHYLRARRYGEVLERKERAAAAAQVAQ